MESKKATEPRPPEKQPAATPFLSFKTLLLSALFIVILLAIKQAEPYSFFFEQKIMNGYEEISSIKDMENYTDIEVRKQMRWGNGYYIVKQIKTQIKDPNAIVLVPPAAYINSINPQLALPEPSIAYYFNGLRTSWGNVPNVYKCTHAFVITKQGADIIKIENKGQIDSLLNIYKPFPYTL